ncbi:MAG: C25 family cysteine peptidase [Candidatus Delongbacteria bacterium]|nr:C25 family cysteine peptidase [Candidatus Delongbacteria bacterium]
MRILVVLVLFLVSTLVFSEKIKFQDSWGPQGFSLTESKSSNVSLTHSVNEFSMTEKLINNEMLTTVQLTGVFLQNDEGAPNLPGSARYIAIPQGASAEYVISEMQKEVYQNIDLAPAPNIPMESVDTPVEYIENSDIYSNDAFYPSSPVILSEPSKIRGVDVVMLGITPFQYNPVTKELIVYRDIKVDVNFVGGNGHFGEDRLRNKEWDRIIKNTIINNTVLKDVTYKKTSDSKSDDFEYIIICPDDATFITYANQLKDFRIKQGIRTGVVTTTQIGGNTEAAIEAYINNAYNNWDIPPSAVLLMADWGAEGTSGTIFAPTFASTTDSQYDGVSDNFYADVDNSDGKALPEITLARMTAQNEDHLQTMVSKIINNETNPTIDPNFYNTPITALGWQTERWFQICSETIGGYMKNVLGKSPVRINALYEGNPTVDPWSTGTNTSQVIDYFGPNGRSYIPATPQELGLWTGGDATDVANAINTGAFMLMHRDHGYAAGWGEPDFTTPDIDMLTNTNPTFIFSMNCESGAFDYTYEVFAERFHRYTYNGQNSGALGVLVASQISYSFVNDAYTWGVFDYMWPDYMDDYGAAPTNNDEFMPAFASVSGKYFLDYSSWPYNTVNKLDTNYLFHLHGDAYMVVYTEVPQNLTINSQDLYDGETVFYVSADLGANIALVANGVILGTATGTGSMIGITIPPQNLSTEVILTVTKQNYFRYEETIVVDIPITDIGGSCAINRTNADYGYVTVGGTTSLQFTITNSHSTEFLLGDITTVAGYTVALAAKDIKNTVNYVVAPSSSKTYNLIFEPTAEVTYNGNITITSSDTGHATEYISVTGAGSLPDINVPTNTSATAVPEGSVSDSFVIQNTGLSGLSYSMNNAYIGFLIQGGAYTTNDFSTFPGTGYTNSGWVESSGAARATGSGVTCTLTSPVFDISGAGNPVYLEFTQNFSARSGSWIKVEYYTGSAWVEVYNETASTTVDQNIELPIKSANTQVRFIGYTTRAQGATAYWDIDNIVVSSEEVSFNWLSFNSSITGLVAGSESETINLTYDATGLPEGTYDANITIASDDPDEPSEVIAVQFNVSIGGPVVPSVPANIVTSISGVNLVIDWDVSADATGYDIYSSDDPYGTFTFTATVGTNQYTVPANQAKLFYYIVAKN